MEAVIPPKMMSLLICPACREKVFEDHGAIQCGNPACRKRFPIEEGVPVMRLDRAEDPGEEAHRQALARRAAAAPRS